MWALAALGRPRAGEKAFSVVKGRKSVLVAALCRVRISGGRVRTALQC